jgi:hypothetical protein
MEKQEAIELLKSSKTKDQWNENTDKIKAAFGGYPEWWYATVVTSGLMDAVLGEGASQIKIQVIEPKMTVRDKIEEMIFERGVFEKQARAMMDFAIPKIDVEMHGQNQKLVEWDAPQDENDYPFYAVVFMIYVKPLVVEWIDANLPLAWYRPMFADKVPEIVEP